MNLPFENAEVILSDIVLTIEEAVDLSPALSQLAVWQVNIWVT